MDTRFLLLLSLFALGGASGRYVVENIILDNGLSRGEWGPLDMCPDKSYAFAFEIKYSKPGYVDDTSVNAIQMYCRDDTGAMTGTTISTEGKYGSWQGMRTCQGGEFLEGVRANVVPEQGFSGDDLGVDNVQMRCSDDVVLEGLADYNYTTTDHEDITVKRDFSDIKEIGENIEEEEEEADEDKVEEAEKEVVEFVEMKVRLSERPGDYGSWGSWVSCSPGNRICGHQSCVEPEHTIDDDAGLTNIIFFCCTVP